MSTRSRQNKKTQALLSCNRKLLSLPDNVPAVHLQFTEYYFPDNPNISGIAQVIFVLSLFHIHMSKVVSWLPLNSKTDLFEYLCLWMNTFSPLPVPTSNLYAQVNGLQFTVDPPSVLWISLFSRGLLQALDQVKAFYHLQDSSKTDEHIDIRMDAAQLKVSIERMQTFLHDNSLFYANSSGFSLVFTLFLFYSWSSP